MAQTVQLATARELAAAGTVRDTWLVGQVGGYAVMFKLGTGERALATKTGTMRLFAGLDAAVRLLRNELGINQYHVDASGYLDDPGSRRRRPDRTAALQQAHQDAAYTEFLREGTERALQDNRPALSSTDAAKRMDAVKEKHQARLEAALGGRRAKR